MTFDSGTLSRLLEARGLTIDMLATLTSISVNSLQRAIEGNRTPTKKQLFKLSDVLAVPAYAFFMEGFELDDPPVMDFRSRVPHRMKFGRDTRHFKRIFELRDFLADLFIRLDLDPPQNLIAEQPDENPEQFAAAIGKQLNIEHIQKNSKTKKDFYRALREAIEGMGIYTVQNHFISDEIDGFTLYHERFTSNLIYVNSSKRNHGAKAFTIAHELAHILGKRSAVSNNYQNDNEVERFCNAFAASLLLPRDRLFATVERRNLQFDTYEGAVSSADKLSQEFKTSVSAALVRTAELGLSKWEHYQRFAQGFGSNDFLDTIKPRGGGGEEGPEPGIIDLAMLGKRAVAVITSALREDVTNEYEIYKRTGLSKKRIQGLAEISDKQNITA